MWSALPKTQRHVKTLRYSPLRYSPCDDTPTAATLAVTTVGVPFLICKNVLFLFPSPPCGPRPCRKAMPIDWYHSWPPLFCGCTIPFTEFCNCGKPFLVRTGIPLFGLDQYSLVFTYHLAPWGALTLQYIYKYKIFLQHDRTPHHSKLKPKPFLYIRRNPVFFNLKVEFPLKLDENLLNWTKSIELLSFSLNSTFNCRGYPNNFIWG